MEFFAPCVVRAFEVVQRVNIFKVVHFFSFLETQKATPKQIQRGFRAYGMLSKDKAV
jgi:hypothetical protein